MSEINENKAAIYKAVGVNPYITFQELANVLIQKKDTFVRGAYYQPNAKEVRRRFLSLGSNEEETKIYSCSIPGESYMVDWITSNYPFKFLRYLPIDPYDTLEHQENPVYYLDLRTGKAYHCSFKSLIVDGGMAYLVAFDCPEKLFIHSSEYWKRFVFLDPASDITK